jgi:iron complex transport system substrate-binding protein
VEVKQDFLLVLSIIILVPFSCPAPRRGKALEEKAERERDSTINFISFVDDDKNVIEFQKPFTRIIPLYSAHVENLFAIGAGTSVIGVPRGTDYPVEAAHLPAFDYNGDPEHIIGAEPDLVLIRPFVRRQNPDYIKKIEEAGIPVVSLYPESFEEFDTYILRLGMLSGKLSEAEKNLKVFHRALEEIHEHAGGIQKKKTVFFESTDNEIRTAAANSLPAKAIEFAGGINATPSLPPISAGSSIARFGIEALLDIADDIDVYVVQQGAMNRSAGIEALKARPGFSAVKAVQKGQVLFINERLISSVTFRYLDGVRILADYLYPEPPPSIDVTYN